MVQFNMLRSSYRERFRLYQSVLKLSNIASDCNVPQSSLSKFMKGEKYDTALSDEALERMEKGIANALDACMTVYQERS